MLRSLRLKLAMLYFGSALGIVILLAAGTYIMLDRFFIRQVDLALQYKMAAQFRLYGLTLPAELNNAEKLWLAGNSHATPVMEQTHVSSTFTSTAEPTIISVKSLPGSEGAGAIDSDDDHEEDISTTGEPHTTTQETIEAPDREEDSFDSRLSSIFIVPITTPQGMTSVSQAAVSPIDEDSDASQNAMALGYDLRTVHLSDGTHVRLLTYRTSGNGAPTVIQIGRLLNDQDSLLRFYLMGLLILGFIASLMISFLSWYLSGRSIKPAQKAWDRQQMFISNASHEMRAPLTLIRANADYAVRSGKPRDMRSALMGVVGEVDYMNHLVDDQLLLSRLDSHQQRLERKLMTTGHVLQEIVRVEEVVANARGVHIESKKTDYEIVGDPDRTRQVLLTLIDNALRFSKPGGKIELGAVKKAGRVNIYVKDNGSGIAPEYLDKLFERFYQVPGANEPGARTNGLGLSIAKALVEAQGGQLWIESQVGKGTTAWLSMPTK